VSDKKRILRHFGKGVKQSRGFALSIKIQAVRNTKTPKSGFQEAK
jgi:hypothetical protein